MRHPQKVLALPVLLAMAGCSGGDPIDIGDDRIARTGENLSDYAAVWVGYAEAYQFDTGSDRIRLTLDENGAGTLEVGDAPPFPPATDPDADYPDSSPSPLTSPDLRLRSGFAYTVRGAVVESRRLRLGLNPLELFRGWCELQVPLLVEVNSGDGQASYSCLPLGPSVGFGSSNDRCFVLENVDEPIYVSCTKLALCKWPATCLCTQHGCGIPEPEMLDGYEVQLDAAFEAEGEELEGTFTVGGGVTIRMTRQ